MSRLSTRNVTIAWEDPLALAGAATGLDGLTFLRRVASGELAPPPIAALLGFDLETVEPGRAVFTLDPDERHYNPIGMVHGGIAATLLDSAMGCAVHASLEAGVAYSSLDLSVHFVRPIGARTGTIACEGEALHVGRRTATARAQLVARETGKLLAHGTTTILLTRPT